MTGLITKAVVTVSNRCLMLLRNRQPHDFTREEIRYLNLSFGQHGEDLAAVRWAERLGISRGVYVDVGAFHPAHMSNTLLLYKAGWRGVNIDMVPDRVELFRRARPRDYNFCGPVSDEVRDVNLEIAGRPTDKILATGVGIAARTTTLNSVLAACTFPVSQIDYLNVDVEGHDLVVIRSLDFDRYRPRIISVEALTSDATFELHTFFSSHGYALVEKVYWTFFFVPKSELIRVSLEDRELDVTRLAKAK